MVAGRFLDLEVGVAQVAVEFIVSPVACVSVRSITKEGVDRGVGCDEKSSPSTLLKMKEGVCSWRGLRCGV